MTLTAGILSIRDNFWPKAVGAEPGAARPGLRRFDLHGIMMVCAVIIFAAARAPLDAGVHRPGASARAGRSLVRP